MFPDSTSDFIEPSPREMYRANFVFEGLRRLGVFWYVRKGCLRSCDFSTSSLVRPRKVWWAKNRGITLWGSTWQRCHWTPPWQIAGIPWRGVAGTQKAAAPSEREWWRENIESSGLPTKQKGWLFAKERIIIKRGRAGGREQEQTELPPPIPSLPPPYCRPCQAPQDRNLKRWLPRLGRYAA